MLLIEKDMIFSFLQVAQIHNCASAIQLSQYQTVVGAKTVRANHLSLKPQDLVNPANQENQEKVNRVSAVVNLMTRVLNAAAYNENH